MKAILIIKSEHKWLQAMLYTLEQLVNEIMNGADPDYKVLHGITTYLDRFINTYHHPKEDNYLLPKLLLRHPASASLITEIHQEHVEGEKLFIDLLKALSAYEFSENLEYSNLPDAVCKYIQFEQAHAMKEEKHILTLATKYLEKSDWDEIDSKFDDNNDPVFGNKAKSEFRNLYSIIVSKVPAPFGLGKKWEDSTAPSAPRSTRRS